MEDTASSTPKDRTPNMVSNRNHSTHSETLSREKHKTPKPQAFNAYWFTPQGQEVFRREHAPRINRILSEILDAPETRIASESRHRR